MHHAYLYSEVSALPDFSEFDSADLIQEQFDKLPIDAVRDLVKRVYINPIGALGKSAVVIKVNTINQEAQNALLKLLEEPPVHATIHVVMVDQSRLLPTLRSRFMAVVSKEHSVSDSGQSFLAAPYKERLEVIAEKTKAKDTAWQHDLLVSLEHTLIERSEEKAGLEALLFTKQHIAGPGAAAKMLLEHLALSLPVLK